MTESPKLQEIENIRIKYIKEQRKLQLRKLRSSPGLIIGFCIILVLALLAIFAPVITNFDPYEMKATQRLMAPDGIHLFGTDEFGRDLLTRVVYGARVSMSVGFIVCFLSGIICLHSDSEYLQ